MYATKRCNLFPACPGRTYDRTVLCTAVPATINRTASVQGLRSVALLGMALLLIPRSHGCPIKTVIIILGTKIKQNCECTHSGIQPNDTTCRVSHSIPGPGGGFASASLQSSYKTWPQSLLPVFLKNRAPFFITPT